MIAHGQFILGRPTARDHESSEGMESVAINQSAFRRYDTCLEASATDLRAGNFMVPSYLYSCHNVYGDALRRVTGDTVVKALNVCDIYRDGMPTSYGHEVIRLRCVVGDDMFTVAELLEGNQLRLYAGPYSQTSLSRLNGVLTAHGLPYRIRYSRWSMPVLFNIETEDRVATLTTNGWHTPSHSRERHVFVTVGTTAFTHRDSHVTYHTILRRVNDDEI